VNLSEEKHSKMIHQYIEVSASWKEKHISQFEGINSAVAKNGKHYTSANTRVEFPQLFEGNEPIVELDNQLDFEQVNEE
jgi:hypothetical protein